MSMEHSHHNAAINPRCERRRSADELQKLPSGALDVMAVSPLGLRSADDGLSGTLNAVGARYIGRAGVIRQLWEAGKMLGRLLLLRGSR
jgi:hypothetical protein